MKKILVFALAILCLNTYAQQAKRYAIKSGYIKYEITGNTEGTKELWWDDYGQKTREVEESTTTTKMFGMKNVDKKHILTIVVKDKFWAVDYINGTANQGTVPFYDEAQEYAGNLSEAEQKQLADDLLNQLGGQRMGNETINGYSCDVIKVMGAKSWIYKGIELKSEVKVLKMATNYNYTEFKPGISVSASQFQPPTGTKFDDMSEHLNNLGFGMGDLKEAMDDIEEQVIPVDYPFEQFKKVVSSANISGYSYTGANNAMGIYTASFMSGSKRILVTAQSKQMTEIEDYADAQKFAHNGHTCYYSNEVIDDEEGEDEDASCIFIDYPKHDMLIGIISYPEMSKDLMLDIEDKLQF